MECRATCAFPILPILRLILFNILILCTVCWVSSTLGKRKSTVPKPAQKIAKSSAEEARTELVSRITAQAPSAGEHSTAINGLVLFRRTQATACYRAAVEPSLTVFVQGKKRMTLGGTEYLCGPSSFFLSSIDVPIESQIVEASEEVPLLSMLLRLDMSIVREILNREELPEAETSSQRRGVAIGQAPAGLLNACSRLMKLLDTPEDIAFLSHLIQREIIYRILKTPQGVRLRTIATTGDLGNRTARAPTWVRKPTQFADGRPIRKLGFRILGSRTTERNSKTTSVVVFPHANGKRQ